MGERPDCIDCKECPATSGPRCRDCDIEWLMTSTSCRECRVFLMREEVGGPLPAQHVGGCSLATDPNPYPNNGSDK